MSGATDRRTARTQVDVPTGCDLAVIGGGILGLAVARELRARWPEASIVVLEREAALARHQTGHNSGVIHAGIYYEPGSLKAQLCVAGAQAMYEYCDAHGIAYERRGKVIVARDEHELGRLDELERRGRTNGVQGLRRLNRDELWEIEPHCRGVAALHSPYTGVVDFAAVAQSLADELDTGGVTIACNAGVQSVEPGADHVRLSHRRGQTCAGFAVFCAGIWSDRLAVMAGAPADPRIVPFRGAYLRLRPERVNLVRSLIYPVPDPALPFLGVHLSRHVGGEVSLGPTALLSPLRAPLQRRGNTADGRRSGRALDIRDVTDTVVWPGTWRMLGRWWRTGTRELRNAVDRRALADEASTYVPGLVASDFEPWFAGIRAQALARDGRLVDDFVVHATEHALHIRNAPSPAATSSLALARMVADHASAQAGL